MFMTSLSRHMLDICSYFGVYMEGEDVAKLAIVIIKRTWGSTYQVHYHQVNGVAKRLCKTRIKRQLSW